MKSRLKKILKSFLLKIITPQEMVDEIVKYKVNLCKEQVAAGEGSQFYDGAIVANLQHNKNKITIGSNTHIRGELLLFASSGQITIGNNSYIGVGSIIRSQDSISIGSNVLVAHNCTIIDTDSHEINHLARAQDFVDMVTKGHSLSKGHIQTRPIIIEDYAWLSYNVSILKGVTIGKGAIVAAGSVVTKNVEPFTVVAGNPAVKIKRLEVDH